MAGKKKHPFADMQVGDVIEIKENRKYMQTYAHVYGGRFSQPKRFRTHTVEGALVVERVE